MSANYGRPNKWCNKSIGSNSHSWERISKISWSVFARLTPHLRSSMLQRFKSGDCAGQSSRLTLRIVCHCLATLEVCWPIDAMGNRPCNGLSDLFYWFRKIHSHIVMFRVYTNYFLIHIFLTYIIHYLFIYLNFLQLLSHSHYINAYIFFITSLAIHFICIFEYAAAFSRSYSRVSSLRRLFSQWFWYSITFILMAAFVSYPTHSIMLSFIFFGLLHVSM